MAKHLSIRLPWHDRGWDGHVCDRPRANVYCAGEYGLKAHNIKENKNDVEEEGIAGRACHTLKKQRYLPPCLRTIQTFGGREKLPFVHAAKEFLHSPGFPIQPVCEDIPPFTTGTWPYDRVFRRTTAAEDVPEEFQDRYSPEEARRNIDALFEGIRIGRSLAFYYLNYDNPLNSERRRYVLVGAAEIDAISRQQEWENMDPTKAARYGALIWNRLVTNGYGDGRGARLPYDVYLRSGLDPAPILAEVPLELSQHFKYVCREFTDDEAAIFLMQLLEALERGQRQNAVDWPWDPQIDWVKKAYGRVLKDRGAFPGLGPVLEALGFSGAAVFVERELAAKGEHDPRQRVFSYIANPASAPDLHAIQQFQRVRRTLELLPEVTQKLLLDRLVLFELTVDQVKLLAGSGLLPEKDRIAAGLRSTPAQILENPYRIIEEYDPIDHEDRIPFHRIDNGIFLSHTRAGSTIPGLEIYAADDPRRLRAAIFKILHDAAAEGHSFLPQDEILGKLQELKLPGAGNYLGAVTLARDLEFYQETLHLRKEGDLVAWQLKAVAEDEELIRSRVRNLLKRRPWTVAVQDWGSALPKLKARTPQAAWKRARESQAAALQRLACQPFSLLTGGAGTGKTSVLAALVKTLKKSQPDENFLLLTPTGKAAVRLKRRIREVAGLDLEPRTIHSFLSKEGWMDWNTWRPLREGEPVRDGTTTVIIDECSMLDLPLLATVFRALDWTQVRRLILCGDPQQLPPIGLGAPFKNLVDAFRQGEASTDCVCALTENCRQLEEQSIALRLAELFSERSQPETADELLDKLRRSTFVPPDLEIRFFTDEHDLPEKLADLFVKALDDLLRFENPHLRASREKPWEAFNALHGFDKGPMRLDALEVLSPYRAGYFGSDAFNCQLQALLRGKLMARARRLGSPSGRQYIGSDKVLQIQNVRGRAQDQIAWKKDDYVDFYVANGELGKMVMVKFDANRGENYGKVLFETAPDTWIKVDKEWAESMLDLGYALTVHKAQGSDFAGVLLVIPKEERQRMLTRELLYTALTRFTKRLYLLIQGAPGDLSPLLGCLWRGASAYLRRNTSLYTLRPAIPDLEDFHPDRRIHRTLRGELVASKSELLISTRLAAHRVPYYYERPLVASDGSVRRPDFTIPVEDPEPGFLYWEHWGMIGDPVYDASVQRRRDWYKKHGFFERLIETDEVEGLDVQKIDQIIRDRILP